MIVFLDSAVTQDPPPSFNSTGVSPFPLSTTINLPFLLNVIDRVVIRLFITTDHCHPRAVTGLIPLAGLGLSGQSATTILGSTKAKSSGICIQNYLVELFACCEPARMQSGYSRERRCGLIVWIGFQTEQSVRPYEGSGMKPSKIFRRSLDVLSNK